MFRTPTVDVPLPPPISRPTDFFVHKWGCEMLHSVIQGVNPQGRLYGRNI